LRRKSVSAPESSPFAHAAQAGQAAMQGFLSLLAGQTDGPLGAWTANSARVSELQSDYQREWSRLWTATLARQRGEPAEPVIAPERSDRRFAAAEWRDNPYYDYLKQSYLLTSRLIYGLVEAADADARTKHRLRFFARQFVAMLSPANYAATNPEALKAALESQGETLARGVRNLIGDAEKGRISQTDEGSFGVGRNLAVTPGAVVFENEIIQLVQYAPATPQVRARPLVMVPPCINKYYILDLSRENSFVRYAVERGNTVFMVSWRNPTAPQGHLTWDDYLRDGVLEALAVAREIAAAPKVNALGFCVGGTMLGAALAVLAARGDDRVESATLLTTLLDFSDTGDIAVFVDEAAVKAAEATIGRGGIKPGRDLATVFNALRPNDLVWSYVVNNYLKGKPPEAFDILYWNSDSTNLPGPWYCWYLRNTYLENNLRVPGRVASCGVPVDLGKIRLPAYLLASREDHIVPWKTSYLSTQLLKGELRFVLGASGHIAGVVNPAAKNRRSHWVNERLPSLPDEWLAGATEHAGSWWSDWDRWLARHGGELIEAPGEPGNAQYRPIEDAPGRYVAFRVA
jgi:polyhydroxyalkanoate synthase